MKPCCVGCIDDNNHEYIEIYESDEIYYAGSREPIAIITVTSYNPVIETQLANAVRRLLNTHGVNT